MRKRFVPCRLNWKAAYGARELCILTESNHSPANDSGDFMQLLFAVLVSFVVVASANTAAPNVTAKVIENEVYYHQPLAPCEIPTAVIRIARAVQVPAGVENLADDCVQPPSRPDRTNITPLREKIHLTGKSVGEALNELVAADPRYRWTESDGVIIVRPVSAWVNKMHFLHQAIPSFRVTDQHMGAALDEWRRAMWGVDARLPSESMRGGQRTPEGNRSFSVVVEEGATAIEALDDIVRLHGALVWQVRYCQPRPEARYAGVWMWTLEDAPTGIGVSLKGRHTVVNGKRVDACGGKL
jgi:hypothetical protein